MHHNAPLWKANSARSSLPRVRGMSPAVLGRLFPEWSALKRGNQVAKSLKQSRLKRHRSTNQHGIAEIKTPLCKLKMKMDWRNWKWMLVTERPSKTGNGFLIMFAWDCDAVASALLIRFQNCDVWSKLVLLSKAFAKPQLCRNEFYISKTRACPEFLFFMRGQWPIVYQVFCPYCWGVARYVFIPNQSVRFLFQGRKARLCASLQVLGWAFMRKNCTGLMPGVRCDVVLALGTMQNSDT